MKFLTKFYFIPFIYCFTVNYSLGLFKLFDFKRFQISRITVYSDLLTYPDKDIQYRSSTKFSAVKSGRLHSDESRARISAANKGKIPWNQGKQHSEETRQRISYRTKEAALQRKIALASSLGLTVEEYDEQRKGNKEKQKILKKETMKRGLTDEGRKRISESMRKRWQNEEYRNQFSRTINRKVSEETRAKISKAIKLKWQDEEYRNKCMTGNRTLEQKEKVSATLKLLWSDETFKNRMRETFRKRGTEWKQALSVKMSEMWKNESYRDKMVAARLLQLSHNNHSNTKELQTKTVITKSIPTKKMLETQKATEKETNKASVYEKAKKECRLMISTGSQLTKSVRNMLGDEYWVEEKIKRSRPGFRVIDDASLELVLITEWMRDWDSRDNPVSSYKKSGENKKHEASHMPPIRKVSIDANSAKLFSANDPSPPGAWSGSQNINAKRNTRSQKSVDSWKSQKTVTEAIDDDESDTSDGDSIEYIGNPAILHSMRDDE